MSNDYMFEIIIRHKDHKELKALLSKIQEWEKYARWFMCEKYDNWYSSVKWNWEDKHTLSIYDMTENKPYLKGWECFCKENLEGATVTYTSTNLYESKTNDPNLVGKYCVFYNELPKNYKKYKDLESVSSYCSGFHVVTMDEKELSQFAKHILQAYKLKYENADEENVETLINFIRDNDIELFIDKWEFCEIEKYGEDEDEEEEDGEEEEN